MYHHILIATDGSELATRGLDQGLSLAKSLGARVTVITVTERFPVFAGAAGEAWAAAAAELESFDSRQAQMAAEVLTAAASAASAAGVPAETLHVPDALPATAIVEAAAKAGCDLIVMSSHGRRGLGRLLLGSQTAEVLAHSPVAVLVIR